MPASDPRPLRADAQRNRDKLLDVAVRAFSQEGPDVTLDAIAKEAGVGIGTLYRHFPTREAPDEAMRRWMDRFVDYLTTKRGMADALRAVIASGGNPYAQSRELLVGAITALLSAGAQAGTLRSDVAPADVLASLSGISLATSEPAQREQAGRILDLLMNGLRYR